MRSHVVAVGVFTVAAAIGVAAAAAQNTPPSAPRTAAGDTVIWAVGDLCDDDDRPQPDCSAVADLIAGDPERDYFLTLGDSQYERGTTADFDRYYDPKVGSKLNDITQPVPGNHEYKTPNAAGYFGYFGTRAGDPARGYYSFVTGGWRVIAVNSNCGNIGGCSPTTTQGRWLRGELAQAESCELLFGHHPPITDGKYAPGIRSAINFQRMAYDGGAELLITGHDHNYQRFAPMDKAFRVDDARGVVNIVSGSGGKGNVTWDQAPRSAYRQNSTFGAVRIVLSSGGYEGEFRALDGSVMDRFSGSCH